MTERQPRRERERERDRERLVRVLDIRKHKSVGWQAVGSVDKRQSCPAAQKLSKSDGWERGGRGVCRSELSGGHVAVSISACLFTVVRALASDCVTCTHTQASTHTHTYTRTCTHTFGPRLHALPFCISNARLHFGHTVRMRYMACYLSLAHCSRAMALTANKLPTHRARWSA